MGVNRDQSFPAACSNIYFLTQVTQESISVLQVTYEFISGTASHTHCGLNMQ